MFIRYRSFFLLFFLIVECLKGQNQTLDRDIQYIYSDYFGQLDSSFTSAKNSSTVFLIDTCFEQLTKELKLSQFNNWLSKRLFNENWFSIQGKDYKITASPYDKLIVGKETSLNESVWFNKRGLFLNGRFGKKIKIHTFLSEGPSKLPPFINEYVARTRILPGEGEVKADENTYGKYRSFGGIEYEANKYIGLSFAHGKNFLGDGYRSLFLSDASENYLFGKADFHIGKKINYTTIVAEFLHYTPDMVPSGNVIRQKKYGSFHYLNIAAHKKLHIALFESVVWGGDSLSRSNVELNYLNPFVVMRPYEYNLGSADKVQLGTAFKYLPFKSTTFYGQFLLTEFKYSEIVGGNNWWGNKYAFQIGGKFHNFKRIKNLFFQVEYNHIRPFTYSHRDPITSFSHAGQPLAHPSGSNLQEAILIANYRYKRWNMNLKSVYKKSGLEKSDTSSIGTDVLRSYNDRESEYGNVIGQGIPYQQFHNTFSVSYLVNPSNMMFFEAGIVNRHQITAGTALQQNYIFVGLRTGILNFYYDF